MGLGDTLAFAALMIALVWVISIFAGAYRRRLAFKERELELLASRSAEKAAQYAAHSERLEARVRVLERIATDKGVDLAEQIEDLRNPCVN